MIVGATALPRPDALKEHSLIITATNVSGGEQVPTFKASLDGFTAIMNRSVELAK